MGRLTAQLCGGICLSASAIFAPAGFAGATGPAAALPDSVLSDTLNKGPGPASIPEAATSPAQAATIPTPPTAAPASKPDSIISLKRALSTLTGTRETPDESARWKQRGPYPGAPLLVSVPAGDIPAFFEGGFDSPSMRQSLLINAGATQWANQSIAWAWSGAQSQFLRSLGTYASLGLFAYYFTYLPPGGGWLHEEWHRAVLTRRDIESYDGIYHWDIGAEAVAVDHVKDTDLAALKAKHPADFIRLMEAGGEGEVETVRLMRRRNFFLGRPSEYDRISWWVSGANGTAYLWYCSVEDFDQQLMDANAKESKVSQRDFTGLDYRAWVHDLRRPDAAYGAGPRGRTHPTGSGYDRYLLYSDLTAGERDFLQLQAGLSVLNVLSGQHLGWDWFYGTNPFSGQAYLWNVGLTHHLTPFGFAVGADFLARQGKAAWVFTAQGLASAGMVLPCLGAELFRYPVAVGAKPLFLSASASAWLQPDDLRFRDDAAEPGASILAGVAFPVGQWLEIFAEGDAKTAGWVPGNAYLDAALQGRAGLQLRL